MSIGEILNIGFNYLGDYFNMIFEVFTRPRSLHKEIVNTYGEINQNTVLITPSQTPYRKRLDKFPSKLIVNSTISIFLGSFLYQLNPAIDVSTDFMRWLILVMLFWIMYSLLVFGLFKLFRGRLDFVNFLAVSLQIIASAYIVSSFISLLSSMFQNTAMLFSMQLPMVVYISVHSLLLVVLISISIWDFIG
jgi:hypothetical protein